MYSKFKDRAQELILQIDFGVNWLNLQCMLDQLIATERNLMQQNNMYQTPMQQNNCLNLAQMSNYTGVEKMEHLNMDQNFDHQMSVSNS